jgi:hypothetical protein
MWGMPGVGRGASVGSMKSEPEMAGNTLSPMHLNSFSKRNDSFFQRKDVEKQTRVLTRRRSDWDWKRKIFGIGPQTWSTPKSDLIHPESPFAQGVIMMSSLLLVRSRHQRFREKLPHTRHPSASQLKPERRMTACLFCYFFSRRLIVAPTGVHRCSHPHKCGLLLGARHLRPAPDTQLRGFPRRLLHARNCTPPSHPPCSACAISIRSPSHASARRSLLLFSPGLSGRASTGTSMWTQ